MRQVCLISFLESVRSHIFHAILVFSFIFMFLSMFFAYFFMQDVGKVVVDFNLSAIAMGGLLISFFVSVGLIGKDLDKRTIYFVLGRGISREKYIYGKFAGLLLIVFTAYILMFAVSFIPLLLMKELAPLHFKSFSGNAYFLGVLADLFKCILLNAVIIFLSSFVTTSFTILIFSIFIYVTGETLAEVIGYLSVAKSGVIIESVIGIAKYLVPNFAALDFKLLVANGIIPSLNIVIISIAYSIIYSIILIFFAGVIFKKREFL